MTERGMDEWEPGEETLVCLACGTRNRAGDRFCAECGTSLPERPSDAAVSAAPAILVAPEPGETTRDASLLPEDTKRDQETAAWIFGARPAAVVVGGLLFLVLAAAFMAIGQRDATGTIVMLSICLAPLGLLILAIGIARSIAGVRRG